MSVTEKEFKRRFEFVSELPRGYDYRIASVDGEIRILGVHKDKKPIAFLYKDGHVLEEVEIEPVFGKAINPRKPLIVAQSWLAFSDRCKELGVRYRDAIWIDSIDKMRGLKVEQHEVYIEYDAHLLPDFGHIEYEIALHRHRGKS